MATFGYILTSTACLSIFYLACLVVFKRETNHKLIRFYLLASILLSLVLPFNSLTIPVDFLEYTGVETSVVNESTTTRDLASNTLASKFLSKVNDKNMVDQRTAWIDFLLKLYLSVSVVLIIRITWNIGLIVLKYSKSKKTWNGQYTIVELKEGKSSYSFFKWIFINQENQTADDAQPILLHEMVHATQGHSFDNLVVELLAAVMWFNPLVWKIRNKLKLVHEYLADEGAIDNGIDKLNYEILLLNQVTEVKLVGITSNFTSSTLKKRIIMLNTSKSTHRNRFRIVTLVPVTIALFLGTAISNGQNSSDAVSNRSNDQFVVVVDAGHGGFDKGATAKDNEFEKDINLSITKMLKERERSNSNVKIICTREDDNFITLNDRVEKVNGVNPDLFISIHVDAFKENDQVSGIKCYSAITPKYVVESSKAGTMLMDELKQLSGIKTHDEARQANFLVLRESRCPAVLLTLGYLTNENDLTFIADKKNQALVCDKIIDAIEKVRNN